MPEVEPDRGEAEAHYMAVRVDQARKHGSPATIDARDVSLRKLAVRRPTAAGPCRRRRRYARKRWSFPSAPTWMPLMLVISVSAEAEGEERERGDECGFEHSGPLALFAPWVNG